MDSIRFEKIINHIGSLRLENTNVDQSNDANEKRSRASLDDFELGCLLGYGCNAAVYEARLRKSFRGPSCMKFPSDLIMNDGNGGESDIETLSWQSPDTSLYEDNDDHLDDEERLHELTLKEGMVFIYIYVYIYISRDNKTNYPG